MQDSAEIVVSAPSIVQLTNPSVEFEPGDLANEAEANVGLLSFQMAIETLDARRRSALKSRRLHSVWYKEAEMRQSTLSRRFWCKFSLDSLLAILNSSFYCIFNITILQKSHSNSPQKTARLKVTPSKTSTLTESQVRDFFRKFGSIKEFKCKEGRFYIEYGDSDREAYDSAKKAMSHINDLCSNGTTVEFHRKRGIWIAAWEC